MSDTTIHILSVPFAIATVSGAGLLSLLVWQLFRRSPIGNVVAIVTVVMTAAGVYHTLLLIVPPESTALSILMSAKYAGFAAVLWLMIRLHTRIDRSLGEYRKCPMLAVAGVMGFILGGGLGELVLPTAVHWFHGGAALLVGASAYQALDIKGQTERWDGCLLQQSARRRPAEWMRPVDEAVLELCSSAGLVLTPAIIAFNINYSREEVNRRLTTLTTHGFIERVERGKYRITARGEQYLFSPLLSANYVTETPRER